MAKKKEYPTARPELLGLLQACKEKPEDDGPRLILADWLEDHSRGPADDARVHAIRAGVEAARLPEGDERREGLEEEARKLHVKHLKAWLGPLEPFCGRWHGEVERGLLHVTARGGEILTRAGAEAAAGEEYAWVDSLRLGTLAAEADEKLLAYGFLPSLNKLSLARTDIRPPQVARIVEDAQCANLRELDLAQTGTHDRGAEAIAASKYMANLVSLDIGSAEVGRAGFADLAASKTLRSLREVSVARCDMPPADLAPLVEAKALKRLRKLNFYQNKLGDDGAAAIAANKILAGLEELDLGSNRIGDAGAVALAGAKWKGMRKLDLHSNAIGEAGALALAESPALAGIVELDFTKNKAGRRGNTALRERFGGRVKV